MGKIKEHCQEFLEKGGHELGYGMESLPPMKDFDTILLNRIDAYDYYEGPPPEHGPAPNLP